MNTIFAHSNRLIPFFVFLLNTVIFSYDALPLYAQAYPTPLEYSDDNRESASKSPSNVLSEFFFGKRNAETGSRINLTPSDSSNRWNNSNLRHNSDYNVTLKKFFGLAPRKDSIMKANGDVHAKSFSQGLPIENSSVEQLAAPVELSSEQVINGIRQFSDETVQEFDNARRQAERYVQTARRSVDKTTQEIQNRGRKYANNIHDQFQGAQNAFENKALDVSRQGRQLASDAKNYVSKEIDGMKDATSENLHNLRRETNNLLPPIQKNGVDSILQDNQEIIAKARRQRLEELNAILAEHRPEERALHKPLDRVQDIKNERNIAQINRSMIRQTSNTEPVSKLNNRFVSKSRIQENSGQEITKSNLNAKDSETKTMTDLQRFPARAKKSRAVFTEPSPYVKEQTNECLSNDGDNLMKVSDKPHDIIKNGVIRSSAKFIDPKDL